MNRTVGLAAVLLFSWIASASAVDIQVTAGSSIATALAGATAGDRLLVQAGTYNESFALKNGVEIRGGYDASFDEAFRDPIVNVTTVDPGGSVPAITSGASATATTIVDGLTITGGGPPAAVVITGGAPVFRNNRITNNHGNGLAGGVLVNASSTARFEDNRIDQNSSAGSGGGLRTENSTVALLRNTFEDNTAVNGGGGVYVFRGAVSCSLNTFTGGTAGESGGGGLLLQNVTSGVVYNNDFDDNEARNGGALMVRDNTTVIVRRNTFVNNRALGPQFALGGGACVYFHCTVTFDDNVFDGCSSQFNGGGLYAVDSAINVTGNDAADDPSSAWFTNCTAANFGGGAHLRRCTGTVSRVRFSSCGAGLYGGGATYESAQMTMSECLVEGCSAFDGGGLAFYTTLLSNAPSTLVIHCTIYGCSASLANGAGGVLHSASGSGTSLMTLTASLVSHNASGVCFRCTDPAGGGGGRPNIRCSTAFNMTAAPITDGTNCLAAFNVGLNRQGNPLFCTGPSFPKLRDCSPDIGALTELTCEIDRIPGRTNRGVTDGTCPCNLTSIESTSWGMIKSKYR